MTPKTVAFYLPQFHPTEINNELWGPGFTEWHNVASARPRFRGHEQPVLPADLGFYDLRLAETRVQQQRLAAAHRVDAFAWYHYWFSGRRLLNEPFDRMLASPEERFPFMLCWANEAWTRTWSGNSGDVMVEQCYDADDDAAHIRWMIPVLGDERYLRVGGRPVLAVYRPLDLPDPTRTAALWRRVAKDAGVGDLLLLAVTSFRVRIPDPAAIGFDGTIEQQPDLRIMRPTWRAGTRMLGNRVRLTKRFPKLVRFDYDRLVERALDISQRSGPGHFSTVAPGWDNTPRRQRGAIAITGVSPGAYERWLEGTLRRTSAPLVFVNAWNEWAEGAHLEPDQHHGRAFLEAHLRAVAAAGG